MATRKIKIRLVTRNPDDPKEILDSITVTVPAGKDVDLSIENDGEADGINEKAELLEIEATDELKSSLEENATDHAGKSIGDTPNQMEKLRAYFNHLRDLGVQTILKTGIGEIIKNL